MHFKGFNWNPRFGPNPPSHGLSLAPDRPELWVLDAPNSTLHVFDVSALPERPPRHVADVRLSKTMSGSGSLTRSADGRFLYVIVVRRKGTTNVVTFTGLPRTIASGEALHEYVQKPLPPPIGAGKQVFRTVGVANGRFDDWLAPHDARVYRFRR